MKIFLLFTIQFLLSCTLVAQTFEWVKHISGLNYQDCHDMALDQNGNIYLTGRFQGNIDFDPGPGVTLLNSAGAMDVFVLKLDSTGSLIWASQMGGIYNDYGNSLVVDGDGNVFVAGVFKGTADFDPGSGGHMLTAVGGQDAYIQKFNENGNFEWVKQIGGILEDYGFGVEVDPAGNVYSVGSFFDTIDFDPGVGVYNLTAPTVAKMFIQKLDQNGDFLWANGMEGTGGGSGRAITIDPRNNIYVTGSFFGSVDFDAGTGVDLIAAFNGAQFVQKIDSGGNHVWARSTSGQLPASGESICLDPSGNIYTTGWFRGTADFDPGVRTFDLVAAGGRDIYVQKLDSIGDFEWATSIAGGGDDAGNAVSVDESGNVYTTGLFSGTADFDPGPAVVNLEAEGVYDAFVQKLNSTGNLVWASQLKAAEFGLGNAIHYVDNKLFITGSFNGAVDFDPSPASVERVAVDVDIFLVRWNVSSDPVLSVVDRFQKNSFRFYPNPTNGKLTIQFDQIYSPIEIEVTDEVGRRVVFYQVVGEEIEIELPDVAGVYVIKIVANAQIESFQVLKQ